MMSFARLFRDKSLFDHSIHELAERSQDQVGDWDKIISISNIGCVTYIATPFFWAQSDKHAENPIWVQMEHNSSCLTSLSALVFFSGHSLWKYGLLLGKKAMDGKITLCLPLFVRVTSYVLFSIMDTFFFCVFGKWSGNTRIDRIFSTTTQQQFTSFTSIPLF